MYLKILKKIFNFLFCFHFYITLCWESDYKNRAIIFPTSLLLRFIFDVLCQTKKKQLVIPNNLISRPFTGDTCDEAENLCIAQNPCEEDNTEDCLSATANSLDLFNDFNCVCKVGFTGRHCEVLTCFENYLEFMSKCRKSKILNNSL